MIKITVKKIILAFSLVLYVMTSSLGQVVSAEDNASSGGMVEATAEYPSEPDIYGKSAILIDADTGAILYEKNSYDKMYPASITKLCREWMLLLMSLPKEMMVSRGIPYS